MKKFTSLFALLSCLCVVSAQAETTISSLDLRCKSDNWTPHVFEKINPNQWEWTLSDNWDLSYTAGDVEFKIIADGTWIGYDYGNKVNAPSGWIGSMDDGQNANEHNFVINNSKTGFKTYKVTATWSQNDNVKSGWVISIEGLDRCSYTVAGWESFFGTAWDAENSDYDMTLNSDGIHYELTKLVSNKAGYYEFKIAKDHNLSHAAYPSNNYGFSIPDNDIYEVTFSFNPPTYEVNCTITKIDNLNLELEDGEPFISSGGFTASTASYSRTCNNEWGTLCLPFKITTSNYQNVTFYTLDRIENNAMYLNQLTGYINGGTPVIFRIDGNKLEISEDNVDVVAGTTTVNGSVSGCALHGSFTTQTVTNMYYILSNKFWYGTGQITINPYRAYIEGPAPVSENAPFRIEVDDTEGLQFVEQEDGSVKAYFDLQGRKLDGARKGLVIENGKIIMVK